MKHFAWFPVLLALVGIFGAACGSSAPNPLGSTTGSGGADPSGGGVVGPATSVGSNTTTGSLSTGSTSTGSESTGSSTTSGGSCKPGGSSCQAFSECCSGTCSQQVCDACNGEGLPCGVGCCQGLTCYNGKCGSCDDNGAACALASDCCSNSCTQGTCACVGVGKVCQGASSCCSGLSCSPSKTCCANAGGACSATSECCAGSTCKNGACATCNADGATCTTDANCCNGTCTNGTCGPCNSPYCSDALGMPATESMLCGAELAAFKVMKTCLCTTKCKSACGSTSYCQGTGFSGACSDCINSTAGCFAEFQTCAGG